MRRACGRQCDCGQTTRRSNRRLACPRCRGPGQASQRRSKGQAAVRGSPPPQWQRCRGRIDADGSPARRAARCTYPPGAEQDNGRADRRQVCPHRRRTAGDGPPFRAQVRARRPCRGDRARPAQARSHPDQRYQRSRSSDRGAWPPAPRARRRHRSLRESCDQPRRGQGTDEADAAELPRRRVGGSPPRRTKFSPGRRRWRSPGRCPSPRCRR